MTEQQKQAEHDRLRPILFDGAPDWVQWAAKEGCLASYWVWYKDKPIKDFSTKEWYVFGTPFFECKNQPETTLHWTDTLIEREVTHEGI